MTLNEAIEKHKDITLNFVESYKQGFEYKGQTLGGQTVRALCQDGIENYKQTFLPIESIDSLKQEITTLIIGKNKHTKD